MKVLIVGGGGREHALAWKLTRDDPTIEIIAAPGNPGVAELGRCSPVPVTDIPGLLALARRERPALTIVGPEVPLALGIVDAFREAGLAIFGPTRAAARIESSKAFAKEIMRHADVPTAAARVFDHPAAALEAVRALGAPIVVKASGLAAGKGVVVCATIDEAERAIDTLLHPHAPGTPAAEPDEILIEEFMPGAELSLLALTDGHVVVPLLAAQDHKRLLDGDAGPNTGGMGAYAPVSAATPALVDEIVARVIRPTLAALRAHGAPFTGLLYAGLMLTDDGPRVVEFNCRFGDPEAECLLPLLESELLAPCLAVARGDGLAGHTLRWRADSAVTTVVAADRYPGTPRTGDPIGLPAPSPGVHVFHAGTARTADGTLVSAGGRVFAITAIAPTLGAARCASTAAADGVALRGKHFRRDIATREVMGGAGAPRD